MAKMWDARFSKVENKRVNDFNSSISFDSRMFREDIEGSIAHATMLGKKGIISADDSEKIVTALRQIRSDIEDGTLPIDPEAEDIHMFVEEVLTKRIGDAGKRLHTARSRNDQVALDIRLYLKKEIGEIRELVLNLLSVIAKTAEENKDAVMPGYTHLQRAQPVTFGHYMLAYAQMFIRDDLRLKQTLERTAISPLGSGALASTTYPIDRQMVAELLGLDGVTENSMDGVSDRDFLLELAFDLSVIMMHLSRFSEEIILWCSSEFSFIDLDDAFSTGSSIMPQKKNPDIAELVRGKTGRVYGDLTTVLTMMKGIPLAYNKDMQEDKEAIFDAIDNAKLCLELFASMLDTLTVKRDNLRKSASGGFINATDCADYLVGKGLPFRDAYRVSGRLVAYCIENKTDIESLDLDTYRQFSPLFDEGVYDAVNLDNCVNRRTVYGGPSIESVERQIGIVKSYIQLQA
ncbi:MAG: argininosuccinate lyase [Ruminococcaceae bacterium]|nr:argininosuccinate lyase [Oscillospiraceae bacterium]